MNFNACIFVMPFSIIVAPCFRALFLLPYMLLYLIWNYMCVLAIVTIVDSVFDKFSMPIWNHKMLLTRASRNFIAK